MRITAIETISLAYDMPYALTYARGEYQTREEAPGEALAKEQPAGERNPDGRRIAEQRGIRHRAQMYGPVPCREIETEEESAEGDQARVPFAPRCRVAMGARLRKDHPQPEERQRQNEAEEAGRRRSGLGETNEDAGEGNGDGAHDESDKRPPRAAGCGKRGG